MVPGHPLCAWPCFWRFRCINLLDPHEESEAQGSRPRWEPGLQLMVAKNQGPMCPQLPHSLPRDNPGWPPLSLSAEKCWFPGGPAISLGTVHKGYGRASLPLCSWNRPSCGFQLGVPLRNSQIASRCSLPRAESLTPASP